MFFFNFFLNFILFLNLKHCISFAKHQNESATAKVDFLNKSLFDTVPHACQIKEKIVSTFFNSKLTF